MSRSTCVIEYEHTFAFPVAPEQLWAAMGRFDCFCLWWPWLREFTVEGVGLESGTALHGVVVPPLPYRMRLDVVLNECVPACRIEASIRGDLEGVAGLKLEGDATETRVLAVWTIEMMQRPMRLAARFGYPLLRWGHDRVVDATVDGFRRHLVDDPAG